MALTMAEILRSSPDLKIEGDAGVRIAKVTDDSRRCGPGALFVAVAGADVDGHRFLPAAIESGCSAVVLQADRIDALPDPCPVPFAVAVSTRPLPGRLARECAGRPDLSLVSAGITGTNGKTTTAYLMRGMLDAAVGRCGLLGTIIYDTGRSIRPAPLTTPGGVELFGLLGEMKDAGCRAVALEISSHALDQRRAADLALDVAVLTNLSRDHLDYHRDFASYLEAKARIFDLIREGIRRGKREGVAAINADDPAFADLDTAGLPVLRYATGWRGAARDVDLRVAGAELGRDGTLLELDFRGRTLKVSSPLVGRFNVENLTAALAAGLALDLPADVCCEALSRAGQVPGRMEPFRLPGGGLAVVDYAHTPDALEAVLKSCRELTDRRLLTVFGCGGDRDRGKRPQMGAVAAREADATWITSDNPRGEDPESICAEIAEGYRDEVGEGGPAARVEVDRTAAITGALAATEAGDTLVIAGKGHEDYQLVAGRRLDLDDRALVRDWIGGEGSRG